MEYHYLRLANELEQKIRSGKYRAGEKLPSLRSLRAQTGRSLSTVYQAYTELENRGMVDVRDKSGFYARPLLEKILPLPIREKAIIRPHTIVINVLSSMIQNSMARPRLPGRSAVRPGNTPPGSISVMGIPWGCRPCVPRLPSAPSVCMTRAMGKRSSSPMAAWLPSMSA